MSEGEQLVLDFKAGPPPVQLRQLWTPDDIYNNANAETVASFKEDGRVERKPCGIHAEVLAEWVCMWANTLRVSVISSSVSRCGRHTDAIGIYRSFHTPIA